MPQNLGRDTWKNGERAVSTQKDGNAREATPIKRLDNQRKKLSNFSDLQLIEPLAVLKSRSANASVTFFKTISVKNKK